MKTDKKSLKAIIFDGGGTIWYSMEILYQHYQIAAFYFGLIKNLKEFPYDIQLMNEVSSFKSFNSRVNMAKALTALLKNNIKKEELNQILNQDNPEETILNLIPRKDDIVAEKMGKFLEKALYNYPEKWYPLCSHVDEILPRLKKRNLKIAILSNRRKNSVVNILKEHKIKEYFDLIEAPDEKEPLIKDFSHILEEFNIDEKEAAFVGDSLLDVKSAKIKKGNIYVIAVLSGMSTDRVLNKLPEELAPDSRIPNLLHLEECLKERGLLT